MASPLTTAVFDLGGVLIDWNPDYLYRSLILDDGERKRFLTEVCSPAWNYKQDEGRTFAEAEAELIASYPEKAALIKAWRERYTETMKGPIQGSVDLLKKLDQTGINLYALTNWSSETFPIARNRFDFLGIFREIVVSGEEKLAKPNPRFYEVLIDRCHIDPRQSFYVDDNPPNVEAAKRLGFIAHRFTTPEDLKEALVLNGLLNTERKSHASSCCR
ncbi:MAG: HAD family phosphatase [Alphaproteobacteria bacterium]|nr:HAD family phosphatase [Alphaproteobacteria bacterium]